MPAHHPRRRPMSSAELPATCSHPPDRRRWEWLPDPAMPEASVLTAICEVCGAVLPEIPPAGAVTLVHTCEKGEGNEDGPAGRAGRAPAEY